MDNQRSHLTDEQLVQFQDDALPPPQAAHLRDCPECRERLRQMERLADSYRDYRAAAPPLPPPPLAWAPLGTLIAAHRAPAHRTAWWSAAAIAAAACAIFAVVVTEQPARRASRQATGLLDRAGAIPAHRTISLSFRGQAVLRPAVLSDADADSAPAALRDLFVNASYSWREPLSARSFQAWRRNLSHKNDTVTVRDHAYTVRTETSAGSLRSVTLTMRAADLRPTAGSFAFVGEDPIESAEVDVPAAQPQPPASAPPALPPEAPATPEDTLRVLAALNSIGADVGDPIDLVDDPQHRHVIVRAGGLAADRQQQLAQVLAPLARVVVDLKSAATAPRGRTTAPELTSSSIPATMRTYFEERLGGPVRVQEITDDVLESGSLLLARAHAYQLLADKFPPDAELHLSPDGRTVLRKLRDTHANVARTLLTRIRSHLRPVLPAPAALPPVAPATWIALTAAVDGDLNQLLAGSYSQAAGERMLRQLSAELQRLDTILHQEVR